MFQSNLMSKYFIGNFIRFVSGQFSWLLINMWIELQAPVTPKILSKLRNNSMEFVDCMWKKVFLYIYWEYFVVIFSAICSDACTHCPYTCHLIWWYILKFSVCAFVHSMAVWRGQKNVNNDDNVNDKMVQQNDKMKFSCKNRRKMCTRARTHT